MKRHKRVLIICPLNRKWSVIDNKRKTIVQKNEKGDGVSRIIRNFAASKENLGLHCLLSALQDRRADANALVTLGC